MAWGALGKMLFASWYCGFRTFQKTSVFFGSYFCSTLKKKEKPARTAGSKQGGQSVLNGIFWFDPVTMLVLSEEMEKYNIGPFFLKLPASSTPPFRVRVFSFLIPPHLFLPSTALPSGCRIVFRLNLKIPPSFHLSLSGQGDRESKEENRCGWDTGKRLIRSVSSTGELSPHLSFSRWWRDR